MKIRFPLALLFLAATLSAQAPPFTGLGDSLGEGVQSADASLRTQPHGYLNLIARQMGVAFPLPLISSSPVDYVGETATRVRLQPGLAAANLAVSGATVDSLLYQQATQPPQDETSLVLEPRSGSQIQIASQAPSPFTVCWIGNNDVLSAVLAFDQLDASQLTPVAQFTTDYATLVQTLHANGGKAVLGNIPDVLDIGFVVTPQDLVTFFGSDLGLPAGRVPTIPTMLVITLGLVRPAILQDPSYVLDPTELATIEQRLQTFNQIIATDAASAGFPVADVHTAFQQIAANPPHIAGTTLLTRYLGGLFSLDGVHPSDIGYSLVANVFIETADQAYGMSTPPIGPIKLGLTTLADPFIDWDGNLQVAGRPFAGLLETLGPFLGVSGDFDFPGAPVKPPSSKAIDPEAGRQFMRQYFTLTGQNPDKAWTEKEAIAIMKALFRS